MINRQEDKIINYWDERSKIFKFAGAADPNTDELETAYLKKFIRKNSAVLDVECGTGNLLNSFLRKCIEQNITALFYVIESHGDFNTILSVYQEFIQELDSKLQCSLPRHDSTIRKYQFDSSLMSKNEYQKLTIHQELDPESLPLWLLKFFDHKDLVYNFESKNIDADNFHQWQGSTEGSHLVSYNQKIALQIYSPFKIVQINDMDRIFGVRAINSGI